MPPALCFEVLFLLLLLCHISLTGGVPCSVTAILSSVISVVLAGPMEGGTRGLTIGFSGRPGVRPLIKTHGVRVI